jgi:hypothetical protein
MLNLIKKIAKNVKRSSEYLFGNSEIDIDSMLGEATEKLRVRRLREKSLENAVRGFDLDKDTRDSQKSLNYFRVVSSSSSSLERYSQEDWAYLAKRMMETALVVDKTLDIKDKDYKEMVRYRDDLLFTADELKRNIKGLEIPQIVDYNPTRIEKQMPNPRGLTRSYRESFRRYYGVPVTSDFNISSVWKKEIEKINQKYPEGFPKIKLSREKNKILQF